MYNSCLSFNFYFFKSTLITMVVMDYAMLMFFLVLILLNCGLYNLNL